MKSVLVALSLASLAATASAATVIYSDDFSGGATKLFGTAPDVRPGNQTWFAPDDTTIQANGVTSSGVTAWLPATLTSNKTYELSAKVNLVPSSASSAWFALGFSTTGTSTTSMHLNTSGSEDWLLLRRNGNWASYAGLGTSNPLPSSSSAPFYSALSAPVTLKLVITTGAAYTLDAYINGVQLDLNGASAGNTLVHTVNPSVAAIGFGASGTSPDVDSFTFALVPEPTGALLSVVGLGAMSCLRRRSR